MRWVTSLLGIFFCIVFFLMVSGDVWAVPAFPGAQGWGAQAWQACDRSALRVVEVTNLQDSGAGSLRAALTTPYPRVVVFRVGGVITLQSTIDILGTQGHSCLIVAGQTAPGGGILITAGSASGSFNMLQFRDNVHDVIIQYIKFRGNTTGNIDINGGHDIIIDHSSFSWTTNDSIDIWRSDSTHGGPINNVTIQRIVNSEIYAVHSTAFNIGGEHAFGYEKQVDHVSLHHNLIGHDGYRNPNVSIVSIDIVNNIMYNWRYKSTITKMAVKADVINNYYKPGPMTGIESDSPTDPDRYRPIVNESTDGNGVPFPEKSSLYVVGNVRTPDFMDTSADNWSLLYDEGIHQPVDASYKRSPWAPLPQSPIAINRELPTAVYASVVTQKDVGASHRLGCNGERIENRDPVDARILSDAANGTQWFSYTDANGSKRPPDSLAEVGGIPAIEAGTPCVDSDHDGMPDTWEQAHGAQVGVSDAAIDPDGDGYTNIEEFLYGISASAQPSPSPGSAAVTQAPTPTGSSCDMKSQGDANCDGRVSLTDFEIFRREFWPSDQTPTIYSDFNGDGKVSLSDWEILRRGLYPI